MQKLPLWISPALFARFPESWDGTRIACCGGMDACPIAVDVQERGSPLFCAVSRCSAFSVRACKLAIGDYWIAGRVVVERKSYPDFVRSLIDGRLFLQAARLARAGRAVVLLERYGAGRFPSVHPHAVTGAIVSLGVMWRLPVIISSTLDESVSVIESLARQTVESPPPLRRYDFKPRRLGSRKLYFLQGLPGVGPALARRLLERFGSVSRVIAASPEELTQVRGVGSQKAARIRLVLD